MVTPDFATWVRGRVAKLGPGARLPTDSALASRWRLCRQTIGKVMRRLGSDGAVVRVRGKGTFVAGTPDPSAVPALDSPCTAAESLEQAVLEAIRNGEFRPGEALPSIKFVVQRYRVTRATVVAAYRSLRRAGEVTKVGRTFWLGSLGRHLHGQPRKEVVLLCREQVHLPLIYHSDTFASQAFRVMEDLLSSAGYLLRYDYVWNLERLREEWRKRRSTPAGMILYRTSDAALERVARVRDIDVPLLLDWEWGPLRRWRRNVYAFPHPEVSTAVAQALAAWLVERRYDGVRVFLDNTNVLDNPRRNWVFYNLLKVRGEAKRLKPPIEHQMVVVGRRESDSLARHPALAAPADALLSRYGATTLAAMREEIRFVNGLAAGLTPPRGREVWVFQRDRQAAAALGWAADHGLDVPRDLAIVGLENDPALYHLGISRCEPDWQAIGYLLAHALMGDVRVPVERGVFLQTRARMVPKLTTP
jgi:DNA-binding transcriptional regulator YhcF (GntR family)